MINDETPVHSDTASIPALPRMVDAGTVRSVILDYDQDDLRLSETPSLYHVDQIDMAQGWPPRIFGATSGGEIASLSSRMYFNVHDQRRSLQVALAHPEVRKFLSGRWEVLGCDLVYERGTSAQASQRARVCLFNYTTNQLVETYVEDGLVLTVALRTPHEYPEAPIEMAQAIALARAHPELKEKVKGLVAHAILQVPGDPHGPAYGHRCMLVIFTDQDDPHRELPARYAAFVDLRLQAVLAGGATPCAADSRSHSRH